VYTKYIHLYFAPHFSNLAGGKDDEFYKLNLPEDDFALIHFIPPTKGDPERSFVAIATILLKKGDYTLLRMPNPIFPEKEILAVQEELDQGRIVGMAIDKWKFMAQSAKHWNFWDDWRIKLVKLPTMISIQPTVPQEDEKLLEPESIAISR
jgi:hypothetical protein